MAPPSRSRLRFLTYLAPSLPHRFFAVVVRHVAEQLGIRAALAADACASGPSADGPDPFSENAADVGFLCSPSYGWLAGRRPAPVELLHAAPVFSDPRAQGRPVYFSDVIVRTGSPVRRVADLDRARWAYNDRCSKSGYYSVLEHLRGGAPVLRRSGSHLRSIRMVLAGEVDAAAIDSNVLALRLAPEPTLADRIRVVASWGPYPIQPIVTRRGLDRGLTADLERVLLGMAKDPRALGALRPFGAVGFAPTSEAHYRPERP